MTYSFLFRSIFIFQVLRSNRQRVIAELMLYFHSNRSRVASAITIKAKGDDDYIKKLPKGEKIDIVTFYPYFYFLVLSRVIVDDDLCENT